MAIHGVTDVIVFQSKIDENLPHFINFIQINEIPAQQEDNSVPTILLWSAEGINGGKDGVNH